MRINSRVFTARSAFSSSRVSWRTFASHANAVPSAYSSAISLIAAHPSRRRAEEGPRQHQRSSRGNGDAYVQCPGAGHPDGNRNKPALHVTARGGGIGLYCFGDRGCTTEAIVAALGLTQADLYDDFSGLEIEIVDTDEDEAKATQPPPVKYAPSWLSTSAQSCAMALMIMDPSRGRA